MSDDRRQGTPRVVEPHRTQEVIRFEMPEDTLPRTHAARSCGTWLARWIAMLTKLIQL